MHRFAVRFAVAGALLAPALPVAAAGSVFLTGLYTETFDSMSTAGTLTPTGWSVFTGAAGTTNATWISSITASEVAAMVATTSPLTAVTTPTSTNINGFNAARSAGSTGDRVLATSPTNTSGGALQLNLVNNTGASVSGLSLSYDTVRYGAVSSANELPGYWLFYSFDNVSWSNVAALNPTLISVPNTAGVSSVTNAAVTFGSAWAAGSTLYLRWVDDNARQTSPDQIIGLNNVSISAVPEPATLALAALGGLALVAGARRRRA